jgi:NAD-dependent deacetylase
MSLFGESLPSDPFTQLQVELDIGFDIVFAIGIPTMFPYLARPLLLAKQEGLPTVEISATPSELSDVVDFSFAGTPARILDLIWDVVSQLGPATRAPNDTRV